MAQEPDEVTSPSAAPEDAIAPSPAAADIRSQIERTRAEMSETIDAIHARLSPARLLADATESVKEATIGRAKRLAPSADGIGDGARTLDVQDLVDTVKAHPLQVAVVGVAAAAVTLRALKTVRNGADGRRSAADAAAHPRDGSASGGRRAGRFLAGALCAGVACWSLWTRFVTAPSR